jgi:hypothetical protein
MAVALSVREGFKFQWTDTGHGSEAPPFRGQEGCSMATTYECWGDDKEDLTDEVRKEVNRSKVSPFEKTLELRQGSSWRVVVYCSKEHANVFEGTGAP